MQNGKEEFLVHSDDDFIATLAELEKKKTPPKPSKKIEPKVEAKEEKNSSRREKKAEHKEEKKSPSKEKSAEKKEDEKPLHKDKTPRESKSSSKKSPEVKFTIISLQWNVLQFFLAKT